MSRSEIIMYSFIIYRCSMGGTLSHGEIIILEIRSHSVSDLECKIWNVIVVTYIREGYEVWCENQFSIVLR